MDVVTTGNPIRLLLVHEHGMFRDSLSRFLASGHGFRIVGECSTAQEALQLLHDSPVDIILLDFEPEHRGYELIGAASEQGYHSRFLLIATGDDAHSAALALKLGASGVFLKSEPLDRLVQAIRLVADGQVWVDARIIRKLADRLVENDLTAPPEQMSLDLDERERQVLRGILNGLTNKKIGASLGLSESSVKNVVQRLFIRGRVKTRSQLVRAAMQGRSSCGQSIPI
jgi:two-component system nitrate/nitrite response regulator NarL